MRLFVLILANWAAIRPILRFLKIRCSHTSTELTDKAICCAFNFPAIHGAVVMFCWLVIANVTVLPPFLRLHSISANEVLGPISLTFLTGITSALMVSFIVFYPTGVLIT